VFQAMADVDLMESVSCCFTACLSCCLSYFFISLLRGCQKIYKVGQVLWAWFSCQRKLADEIVEQGRFCHLQLCTISASFTNRQQQNADHKMILALFFLHLMNEYKHYGEKKQNK